MIKVLLKCVSEDKTVAVIETKGTLDKENIVNGLKDVDKKRCPANNQIENGVTMLCSNCKSPLQFEISDGNRTPAQVGALRAV